MFIIYFILFIFGHFLFDQSKSWNCIRIIYIIAVVNLFILFMQIIFVAIIDEELLNLLLNILLCYSLYIIVIMHIML